METWLIHARPVAAPDFFAARPHDPAAPAPGANPFGALIAFAEQAKPAAPRTKLDDAAALFSPQLATAAKASNLYGALVDPGFLQAGKPALPTPPPPTVEASLEAVPSASPQAIAAPPEAPAPKQDPALTAEAPPLPPARPPSPVPSDRRAPPPLVDRSVAMAPRPDDRNIFEKLFGLGRQSNSAVAYAEPEGGARGGSPAATDQRSSGFSFSSRSAPPSGYDQWTAVYDISARTVYLPDGTRLEAHSGLGDRLDDPRFVSERNRGATPPHLYDLSPREALFHGVQALRLTPVGEGGVYGRAGLLAHTFMLGPGGDSNGCVSFRNYDAFLRAFQQGQIKRLAVVARL